uniref:Uncharacterized protein n=1 Tax=Manihot esculenta TaxID=3983 RepID=A0A2C9UFG6_MANES
MAIQIWRRMACELSLLFRSSKSPFVFWKLLLTLVVVSSMRSWKFVFFPFCSIEIYRLLPISGAARSTSWLFLLLL